jgi:ADP-heptose:LPS heptosyltransferase
MRSTEPPRSVAVFSHQEIFGDGLYKLVFLRGLRAAFPDATLTWMTALDTVYARSLRAVAGPPLLDRVVENCGIGEGALGVLRPPPPGLGPFDLLLDTQSLLSRSLAAWRVPHRRFLSAALLRRGPGGAPIGPHVLDGLFALLGVAAGRPIARDLSPLPLPAPLVEAAREALPGDGPPRIALAPGAGGAGKAWPLDRFIALGQLQAERGRLPVFLLGPQEAGWRARIAAELPDALFPEEHPAFASLGGGPQPLRAAAVAARCAAGVANDAGPGHMIAAAGTPLLSLYGPTRPEKFRPVCRRWAGLRAADFGGREMERIPLPAVAEALDALLRDGPA